MAEWLDTVFARFDYGILAALHRLAEVTGGTLTPLMYAISLLSDGAICMLLLGVLLLPFRRSRRVGLCVLLSVCLGAVLTNLILKGAVARARPYASGTEELVSWWQYVGAHVESDASFPSGHTTATTAAMGGLVLAIAPPRRYSLFALLLIPLMGLSRMYLMVHYPTDVLGGLLCGAIGAVAGYFLTQAIWRALERHSSHRLCRFVLSFDPIGALRAPAKVTPEARETQDLDGE